MDYIDIFYNINKNSYVLIVSKGNNTKSTHRPHNPPDTSVAMSNYKWLNILKAFLVLSFIAKTAFQSLNSDFGFLSLVLKIAIFSITMFSIDSLSYYELGFLLLITSVIAIIAKYFMMPKWTVKPCKKPIQRLLPENLDDEFKTAAERIKNSNIKLSNDQQLKLYALYKETLFGPCTDEAPPIYEITGRAKWESWKSLGDISAAAAARGYIELVNNYLQIDEEKKANKPEGMVPVMLVGEEEDFIKSDDIFFYIAENKLDKVIEFIDKGTDVNKPDSEGLTPLHWACDRGELPIVEYLVKSKANLEAEDPEEGSTPLHYAITSESYDCAEYLIRHGADINHQNKEGETPMDLCDDKEMKEMLEKLSKESN